MKSNNLSNEQLKIITDAIDSVMKEYHENNIIIFTNESDRAKEHHKEIKKNLKDWKRTKECIVPECTKRSIKKSHTIPRGILLHSLSENGHVLTPDFDQKTGQLTLKSIGVGLASTFPGFCSEHEKLFEEFEKPRKLETSKHFSLQIYRAICREAFRTSVLAKQTKSLIESYVKLRNEGLKDLIFKKSTQNGFPDDSNFKSLSVRNDPLIESSNEKIAVICSATIILSGRRQLS